MLPLRDMVPPPIKLHFYCDSSSHRNHDFMVAGGIAIRNNRYAEIECALKKIKDAAGITSEMKWAAYRGGERRIAYEAMVDLMFLLINEKIIAFHSIIANFSEFIHIDEGVGRNETSVNKMYYQLFVHRLCNFYGQRCAIYAYPDRGGDSAMLPDYRNAICAHGYKSYATLPNCVKAIEPQQSHYHHCMQMVDIVVGAIAAKRNNRQMNDNRAALANYVLMKSGHVDWTVDTPKDARFFTVWNFKHQERRPLRPRLKKSRLARPAVSDEG